MEQVNMTSIVCRHPDQVAAALDGEVMMMNIETGKYYALNEVASFIWDRLAEPLPLTRICEAVQAEFDVTSETCERDAMAFVECMVRDGLLQIEQSAPVKGTSP